MSEPTPPRRRQQTTHPKRIYLTEPGEEQIQQWADENGVTFSAANEALAALGAGDPQAALLRTVNAVLRQELAGMKAELQTLTRAVNRLEAQQERVAGKQDNLIKNQEAIAGRLAYTTRTAANIQHLVEELLLQCVRQVAEARPDDFAALMQVDLKTRRGRPVAAFLEQLLDAAWAEAYDRLEDEAAWALADVETGR